MRHVSVSKRRGFTAAEQFVGSFFLLILLGTLGFIYLPGLYEGEPLSLTDAAFTSTSAVCVTGLIVVDTSTYFTFAGQAYILLLIQLGGLGLLTLTSTVITYLGGRPSLRTESLVKGTSTSMPYVPVQTLFVDVARFTFVTEAIGAVLLYLLWGPRLGWREAVWPSIFHSVSAFCNAGFSTNSNSLVDFQTSPMTLLVISILIIVGGLGFVALEEIAQKFRRQSRNDGVRLSVHTRLVLLTSAILLLGGCAMFAVFEWQETFAELRWWDKLSNAFFMSTTARTAGFNAIDYAEATDSSNFLTILLMMIGGSPGSTAGGMKTTTFALIGLLAWSRLRSQPTVIFADRSIPESTVQRAVGLFVITTGIVVVGIFVLISAARAVDVPDPFMVHTFEVVSAFNTVGLSMGITADLPVFSRWGVIVLMFVGRTGPLAIAAALTMRHAYYGKYRLAYEDVTIG